MSGLAKRLWMRNADLAEACRTCAFVRGLADGSLPRDRFKTYVAQDAYFLEAFARAYAWAIARSRDRESLHNFAGLLNGVLDELRLHAGYAARWEIDLRHITPQPATLAYTDFLLKTASSGSVGAICAAMTPCMRLYAHLGRELANEQAGRLHAYSEWINTYGSDAFESLAAQLESLLDTHGAEDAETAALYRQAMRLEFGFFEANAAS